MNIESFTPVIIAAIIAAVVSVVTAALLRRTGKENNETNTFKVVTDQLFELNGELRKELDELKVEVKTLRTTVVTQEGELEDARKYAAETRRVNGQLSRYLGKLIRLWPPGDNLPGPDEELDWEQHV